MPTKKTILLVGGGGYIGSHMTDYLSQQDDFIPIVFDNFSTGHRDAVKNAIVVEGDMADTALLEKVFSDYAFSAVMHFASFIQVGESVLHPEKYYRNNVGGTLNLLRAMLKHRVNYFIFSSTAAVYGEPLYTPMDEKHRILPLNPYGQSKWMVEQILQDFSRAYDFHFSVLRYFNAAGAHPSGKITECHEPETHLIPLILKAVLGKLPALTIYGKDYPTPDGTCIRDYVHVMDLCEAHFLALRHLLKEKKSSIYNLGTGKGYSVKEVIDMVSEVTQRTVPFRFGERRAGDSAVLVADARLAEHQLQWKPTYSDLRIMIEHAWNSLK